MPERELLVRIIGDDRDLQRALRNTDRRIEQIDNRTASFGRNIGRAFAAAGIAVGTSEVFRLAGDAVDAAAALNEEVSKSRQVFGEASSGIQDWSQTTASAFGISQRAALEATGIFGNLLRTVELAPDKAAEMSRALVELAADLSSFNDADPSDVLNAIRSGLIGEAEPLRRYGVLLSEARVQQQAMATTGKTNVRALTDQEKALARYQIIVQDTATAQGDFARTSDSLSNQSKVLRANMDDLSANLGGVLVPALTTATGAANDLFGALERLASVEVGGGLDVGDIAGYVGGWKTINFLIEQAKGGAKEFEEQTFDTGPQRGASRRVAQRLAQQEADAKAQTKQLERSRETFSDFMKGLGLKLDTAGLSGLEAQIRVLQEMERAILRQIEREGRTFKLAERLTQVRLQLATAMEARATESAERSQRAWETTLDALSLGVEMAAATQRLDDDQRELRRLEQAILKRIATEGQTTDLMRQLFNVREEQRRVAEQLSEQRREQRNREQFRQLGLTEEGERPTPSTGALLRRTRNLKDQIKGTVLDTEKTRRELATIERVLRDNFKNMGKEVREAILEMLNDISGALDGQGSRQGPLTKTSGLNTKKILAGIGLSPEEINALRGRLSSLNSAGNQIAGGPPAPRIRVAGSDSTPSVNVENVVYVSIDGKRLTATVTKEQQRTKRRNPKQKRGPNRNI